MSEPDDGLVERLSEAGSGRQIATAIRGGLSRIHAELGLKRDAMLDFAVVTPDLETLGGYVRGFYIMLKFIQEDELYMDDFRNVLQGLSKLCDDLESNDIDEVKKVI